jgi:cytosine deaminase
MGLSTVGRLGVGLPADLVLFRGRSYSELFARSQHDRVVLRNGRAIETTLPDYAELDELQKAD